MAAVQRNNALQWHPSESKHSRQAFMKVTKEPMIPFFLGGFTLCKMA
jgi:hypothetical protein